MLVSVQGSLLHSSGATISKGFVHSDGPEGPPLLHRLVVDWVVEELPSATLSPTGSAHVCSVFLGVPVGSSCLNYLVHSRVVVHMAATESTATCMTLGSKNVPVSSGINQAAIRHDGLRW